MAAAIGKYAARKVLNQELKKYKNKEPAGQKDPYYEYRINPRTGKQKKYKKQIPAYIPEHDANVLASVRRKAYRLDMSLFSLFGMRFGWESVIGIIPVVGDVLGVMLALQVMRKAMSIEGGLPKAIQTQMMMWIAVDGVVGMIPFVGDLLDASIKCNTANCRLLEEYLDKKYKPKALVQQDAMLSQPPAPATAYEDLSDEDDLPQYTTQPASRDPMVTRPERAARREQQEPTRAQKSGRGWFGGRGTRADVPVR